MRIALATCRALPEPDPDAALVLDAFRRAGADASLLAWDDPAAPFAAHDLVVLRSTWNYFTQLDAFLSWVDRTARVTPLRNDPATVRWNASKRYLNDLDARGIPIVPTEFVQRAEPRDLGGLLRDRGWTDVVIKPSVSAGSYRTERFALPQLEQAQLFLDDLVRERDAMVQPWMSAVDTYGERSLVWIAGELTHAIRKSPRLAGGIERVSSALPMAEDEKEFARRVIAATGATDLLYGRVDTIRDEGGALRVMELELVEPSLFFKQCPRALDRFVRAAVEHAGRRGGTS
jgi:hypothetical protein